MERRWLPEGDYWLYQQRPHTVYGPKPEEVLPCGLAVLKIHDLGFPVYRRENDCQRVVGLMPTGLPDPDVPIEWYIAAAGL